MRKQSSCIKLVDYTFACLARMVFMQRQTKDFLLWVRVVVRTSNMKIARCLADMSRNCSKKRAARLFFFVQPIKSLISGAGVAAAVVISQTP